MGGEAKTSTSDNFKTLELEMALRQDGDLPRTRSAPVASLADPGRHGQAALVDEHVHQVHGEADRGRRQGKDAPRGRARPGHASARSELLTRRARE